MPKSNENKLSPKAVIQAGLVCSGKVDDFKDRLKISDAIDGGLIEYLNHYNVAIAYVDGKLEFVRLKKDDANRFWK